MVTKRVSDAIPTVSHTVTFTVTVTSSGPGEATSVQVSDGLPVGLTLVSSTPSQGIYSPDTGVWGLGRWRLGRGDPGGGGAGGAGRGGDQCGDPTAADQFDPDPSNNAGGVTLTGATLG